MTASTESLQRTPPALLSRAERQRIHSVILEVGRLYVLNGWRSVDWLGYCMDPDGEVHSCGRLLEIYRPEPPLPRAPSQDIPGWNYRLHNKA